MYLVEPRVKSVCDCISLDFCHTKSTADNACYVLNAFTAPRGDILFRTLIADVEVELDLHKTGLIVSFAVTSDAICSQGRCEAQRGEDDGTTSKSNHLID